MAQHTEQILLYYQYVTVPDPKTLALWQTELCTRLGLKGRIIIATEGINGTVGGPLEATRAYIKAMRTHHLFRKMVFKKGPGGADHFPRLMVKVKPEIVALGINPQDLTVHDGGKHLSPTQTHELLNQKPDNLVIIDCRNGYESEVGRIEGALRPDTKTFREFPEYIERNVEHLKDKQVLMYCTGGVRCERASALLKKKGVQEVYQMDGGIQTYVEAYPDGHFRGKLYVFDDRVVVPVTPDVLSTCLRCNTACDELTNCSYSVCNRQCVLCNSCLAQFESTCSDACQQAIAQAPERKRVSWRAERFRN